MTDTIPTNRFLGIEGLRNARQLGGYIGADGRAIKDDLLLRTERLDKLSDEAAAALLMYALGVDEETIMEEFLLTNEVYQAEIAGLEAALKNAGYDDAVVGEAQAIVGVKGEYLTAAFDAVKEEYGSIEDYIRNQLGVSDEALHHLREKYLA